MLFIVVSLLTHGRFREPPQRRRRSHLRGSECSSSVGGTSLSLERNLGNTKDHTDLIIKNQGEGRDILVDDPKGKLFLALNTPRFHSHCDYFNLFSLFWLSNP